MSRTPNPIGLIGVGLLGSAIGERLLKQDFSVCCFDPNQDSVARLNAIGAESAASATDVLRTCDVICLSLPNSDVVRTIIADAISNVGHNHLVIDTTTGRPDDIVDIAGTLQEQGARYLEANVAGSSEALRQGRAVLFLGGDADTVAWSRGIINALSSSTFHIGPNGSASRLKLVHNLILGLNRAVLAEGLAFAESLGIDSATALEILKQTPAASEVMHTKGARMVEGNYKPQARLSQHLKDVQLMLEQSPALPLTQTHEGILKQAEEFGLGDLDNSAIIEVYRTSLRKPE